MSCANCVDAVELNRVDASGIKSIELQSTKMSDRAMELLEEHRDVLN
jgi:hypothetical protein